MMEKWLYLDPKTYVLGAFLLLSVPLDWLMGGMVAAVVHELIHLAAIWLLGGQVYGVRIGLGGATIDFEISGRGKEAFSAAAGPAGSLMLIFLCHQFPRIAICGAAQGLFNLLPVYPLDGGRILDCVLEMLLPRYRNRILRWTERCLILFLILAAMVGSHCWALGDVPFLVAVILIIKVILRKRPCKQRKIKVQ